ncbi:sugar phosphate isomerase/epimerase [Pyrococcus furiosus DSM 3638]|uniref:Xylose isomerase-like TIM barrel domain-containing protein n=3 Tax=Pyrococcus furiosus TaxID=2261 RepID=Q8U245_PYRFU|nr:TIM barrel protein [Pyrococcus furiosus]AAL81129.1 hypothetical protein PF1005 [Pyrococcus furiosus DSM 3638]AFN03800.1 hypothetical protein PFC_04255 [Pyrococcus furiosus COM1]QEK78668.1 sugar phosphate isomerase/epimerase [Pyrococcus furiosus DSM 3638]
MKIGVNSYIVREMTGRGFSLDELNVDFVELGFDDAEIIKNDGEINMKILKDLSGLGIEFTIHAPTSDGKNFPIDFGEYFPIDLGTYRKTPIIKRMKKIIKVAEYLDASVIVVHGGDIKESYTKAYVNTLRNLRELKPITEDSGVKIVVENLFEGRIGALPHEVLSFAKEGFEVCFDIGHAFLTAIRTGLRVDEFEMLFPYTTHLHLHDNNGFRDEHKPIGEGIIGFSYVERVLELTNPERAVLEIRRYNKENSVLLNVEVLQEISRDFSQMKRLTEVVEP